MLLSDDRPCQIITWKNGAPRVVGSVPECHLHHGFRKGGPGTSDASQVIEDKPADSYSTELIVACGHGNFHIIGRPLEEERRKALKDAPAILQVANTHETVDDPLRIVFIAIHPTDLASEAARGGSGNPGGAPLQLRGALPDQVRAVRRQIHKGPARQGVKPCLDQSLQSLIRRGSLPFRCCFQLTPGEGSDFETGTQCRNSAHDGAKGIQPKLRAGPGREMELCHDIRMDEFQRPLPLSRREPPRSKPVAQGTGGNGKARIVQMNLPAKKHGVPRDRLPAKICKGSKRREVASLPQPEAVGGG